MFFRHTRTYSWYGGNDRRGYARQRAELSAHGVDKLRAWIKSLHFSMIPLIVFRMSREIHISAPAFASSLAPSLLLPLFLLVR